MCKKMCKKFSEKGDGGRGGGQRAGSSGGTETEKGDTVAGEQEVVKSRLNEKL